VVLLEHAHLLLRPEEAKDLSKIMQFLKRHVSRQINYILNFETEEAICKSLLRLGEGKGFKSKKDKILNVSKLNKNLHQKQNKYAEYKELIENHYKLLQRLKGDFNKKYGRDKDVFPKFKWQKSFRDHYIRNHKDFDEHVKYIYNNPVKHKIPKPENYIFIFTNYPELITEI
jgi:REP element-mobilizing transposase RayT